MCTATDHDAQAICPLKHSTSAGRRSTPILSHLFLDLFFLYFLCFSFLFDVLFTFFSISLFYLSFLFFVVSCFSPSPFYRFIFLTTLFSPSFFFLYFFHFSCFFFLLFSWSHFSWAPLFFNLFFLYILLLFLLSLSFHLLTFLDCIYFSLSSSSFPWSPFPSPPLVGVLEIPFCISICHFFLFLSFCIHVFWNKFCRLKKSILYLFIFRFFQMSHPLVFLCFFFCLSPCFWKIFNFHLFMNFFLLGLFIFVSFFFFRFLVFSFVWLFPIISVVPTRLFQHFSKTNYLFSLFVSSLFFLMFLACHKKKLLVRISKFIFIILIHFFSFLFLLILTLFMFPLLKCTFCRFTLFVCALLFFYIFPC